MISPTMTTSYLHIAFLNLIVHVDGKETSNSNMKGITNLQNQRSNKEIEE